MMLEHKDEVLRFIEGRITKQSSSSEEEDDEVKPGEAKAKQEDVVMSLEQ